MAPPALSASASSKDARTRSTQCDARRTVSSTSDVSGGSRSDDSPLGSLFGISVSSGMRSRT
eukprot:6199028-Pleurochrysis_carterae.AAC.3